MEFVLCISPCNTKENHMLSRIMAVMKGRGYNAITRIMDLVLGYKKENKWK